MLHFSYTQLEIGILTEWTGHNHLDICNTINYGLGPYYA